MTVSARQAWVGFLILFVVALLVVVAAFFWQHVTHSYVLHLLAFIPQPSNPQGC